MLSSKHVPQTGAAAGTYPELDTSTPEKDYGSALAEVLGGGRRTDEGEHGAAPRPPMRHTPYTMNP